MKENLYFHVYQKIEKEVIDLTSSIYFSDEQINVFSLHIAELIIRCSIELESIAKDIYRESNGRDPQKTGDAFLQLERQWNLSRKVLTIISPYTHFKETFCPAFAPFDYKEKSENDYYSTYNAIKHDRVNNISKANINSLIRVLGALYILNIYYRNEIISLDQDRYGSRANKSLGSDFFAYSIAPLEGIVRLSSEKDIIPEECIYRIVRRESEYGFRIVFEESSGEIHAFTMINIRPAFQEYAKSLVGKIIDKDSFFKNFPFPEICEASLLSELKANRIVEIKSVKPKITYSAIIR